MDHPNFPPILSADSGPHPRHAILHFLRTELEAHHRRSICLHSTLRPIIHEPEIYPPNFDISSLMDVLDFCNKTAPLYVLRNAIRSHEHEALLLQSLSNYIYDRWFVPYHGEIEWGQFVFKTVLPQRGDTISKISYKEAANLAPSMNSEVCKKIGEALQFSKILKDKGTSRSTPLDSKTSKFVFGGGGHWHVHTLLSELEHFVLRPIFRAVAVILLTSEFGYKSEDISQMRVLLVRTGISDGMSSPISFWSIAKKVECYYDVSDSEDGRSTAVVTTMETALNFMMELEETEADVFGPIPNSDISLGGALDGNRSCLIHSFKRLLYQARALGLNDKEETVKGPSSQWVDGKIYKTWTGRGALSAISNLATEQDCRKCYYKSIGMGALAVQNMTLEVRPKKVGH